MKTVLFIIGVIFASIGAVGILIPVLPTTPFLIVASLCFVRSSSKAYIYLNKNKHFGPYLEHYRTKQGVSKRQKWKAYFFLWASMLLSIVLSSTIMMKMVLLIIMVCVTIHIAKIKTKVI